MKEVRRGSAQTPRRQLIQQHHRPHVTVRQVPHLGGREHDVGRVLRVVEPQQMADLVRRVAAMAGEATLYSSSAFFATIPNFGPVRSTYVVPASLVM